MATSATESRRINTDYRATHEAERSKWGRKLAVPMFVPWPPFEGRIIFGHRKLRYGRLTSLSDAERLLQQLVFFSKRCRPTRIAAGRNGTSPLCRVTRKHRI